MDYELEQQLAERMLKEAQALRNTPTTMDGKTFGGIYVPNYAASIMEPLQRMSGNRREEEATARLRELSAGQDGAVQRLTKALMAQGTVPQQSLRQGEGPLMEPNIDTTQRPMTPVEENQRQMGIGMEMMGLPKARAMGTQFVNSGVGFPEKQAMAEAAQAQAREQQAARLAQQQQTAAMLEEGRKQRAADSNALRMTIAGMNRGGVNSDIDRQIKEMRLQALEAKAKAPPALPVGAQKVQASLQNLESGVGAYEALLKDYNPQSTDALTDTKRAALSSAFTDLQMRLKEAYELGAITGPDMQVLQSAITDPTSAWGMARGAVSGTKPFEAQIAQSKAALARQKSNFEQQYGVALPEARGATRAPMPGTPTPAAPYTDAAKEERYQEWLRSQHK